MSLHGGRIHDHAEKERFLDFSANINPYGPPREAMKAAARALSEGTRRYPDPDQRALRSALQDWLLIPGDHFAAGNGASDLILRTLLALRPKRVLSVHPTFSEYADLARLLAIPYKSLPLKAEEDFAYPVTALKEAVAEGDLLIVCQPDNPTGRAWEEEELGQLLRACRSKGATLLVDECFLNLTWPPAPSLSAAPWPENLISLRAFTKDFSAPGLRVGFIIAAPALASRIRETGQPWPLNAPGEGFAVWCCREGRPFLEKTRRRIAARREKLTSGLESLGFRVWPGAANFLLTLSPLLGEELQEKLLRRRILVRRCANFPGLDDFYIRLAVRTGSENERLLAALTRILNKEA
jgi:threonine-phosphate decarboxylase